MDERADILISRIVDGVANAPEPYAPTLLDIAPWRPVEAPALLKFAVAGPLACLLCYAAAGLLLRVPALQRIF